MFLVYGIEKILRFHRKSIQLVNQFLDEHERDVMDIWNKAQRGERINKINR